MLLPVDSLKDELFSHIKNGVRNFVVAAPTGSGKSTRLPVMLSEAIDGKILVLQPRRVAARMLAKSVAELYGANVGWHVRFDKHYDESTQIVFLTEGILARMILNDASLKGVGAIVFDEFHERNIYADISLALALRIQKQTRPDLTIAVCSASIDTDSLSEYLGGNSKLLQCGTRLFPIDIQYSPPRDRNTNVWDMAVKEFERISRLDDEGNFLIFMPGAYEITKTISLLLQNPTAKGFDIFALHGDLDSQAQDKILSKSSKRKVIVSTNVAETSLTIDGVDCVIDSGLARVARFDTNRGVNTLLVERVSIASATQRAGRAGRMKAGTAVRLWRQSDEVSFSQYNTPEILRLDLSQILLWLYAANIDIEQLDLFERPSGESLFRAQKTLYNLGALDAKNKITSLGLAMSVFPTQPRYARLLIEGAKRGCIWQSSMVAALTDVGRIKLSIDDAFTAASRDEMVGDVYSEPEEILRLCELAKANSFSQAFCRKYGIHSSNARKAFILAEDFERIARRRLSNIAESEFASDSLAKSILSAFSDHLCVRTSKANYACKIAGFRSGEVHKESRNYIDDIFVAIDLQERNVSGGVSIIASTIIPIKSDFLKEIFPDDFSDESNVVLDERNKRVVARRSVKFRDLTISQNDSDNPTPDEAAKILRDEILKGKIVLKNFDDSCENFITRVNFVAAVCPETEISAIDDDAKSIIFEQMCCNCTSFSEVKNIDVLQAFRDWLSPEQHALLKYLAPKTIDLPNRKRPAIIRYELTPPRAVISSYFKDFFDLDESKIRICDGKIKPTFELLSPRSIPVQTTQNLQNFWKTSWPSIEKELKARYPKHFLVPKGSPIAKGNSAL